MCLQAAIDNIQESYCESTTFLEESIDIVKFIEYLCVDLHICVANKRPAILREDLAEAQRIDKKMQDQNSFRQKHSR